MMNSFKLVQHNVKSASFIENNEKEKKKDIEVAVERLYLTLETISRFEVEKDSDEVSEEEVRLKCFPVALSELRKTVKKVTEAYGIPVVDLPPFEEET